MDCDLSLLKIIEPPPAVEAPAVALGRAERGGVVLAGANVVYRSSASMDAWRAVLALPEDQEEWHPPGMGTRRVERLDAAHIYQRTDLQILWGAIRIQRQAVVTIKWLEERPEVVRNCWFAVPPGPFAPTVAAWDDGSTFVDVATGGWTLRANGAGVDVSYQFWAANEMVPPKVQAWAMSRTLPELMRAFEARVRSVDAR